jgi:tetratricopeptide (TPR) repeat protein
VSVYRIIIEKIPFVVLSGVSCVVTFLTQKAGGVIVDIKSIPLTDRVGNVFFSYAAYIGKMFWPRGLAVFYPFTAVRNIPLWQFVVYALLLAAVSCAVVCFWRGRKYLAVGWLWFVGTLVPVIGLVRFTGSSYADRFTYVPYIGLFIMIGWGVAGLVSRWAYRKVLLGVSMVIVLTAMGIRAHRQVRFWNNSITLFSHAVEVTQDNPLACYNLGTAYDDVGRHQEAIEVYKEAIRIKPDYADACYNLGNAYSNVGRYQEAVDAFNEAISIKPDFAYAYSNLGAAYGSLGRYQDAIQALEQALKIKPDHVDACYNLGSAYGSLGRYPEAIEAIRRVTRIKPDDAYAWSSLGNACGSAGRYQDAIEAFEQALRIKPDYPDARYLLGLTYLNMSDKGSALEQYEILKTLDAERANGLFNMINR